MGLLLYMYLYIAFCVLCGGLCGLFVFCYNDLSTFKLCLYISFKVYVVVIQSMCGCVSFMCIVFSLDVYVFHSYGLVFG